jgi:hypothetical protein
MRDFQPWLIHMEIVIEQDIDVNGTIVVDGRSEG